MLFCLVLVGFGGGFSNQLNSKALCDYKGSKVSEKPTVIFQSSFLEYGTISTEETIRAILTMNVLRSWLKKSSWFKGEAATSDNTMNLRNSLLRRKSPKVLSYGTIKRYHLM